MNEDTGIGKGREKEQHDIEAKKQTEGERNRKKTKRVKKMKYCVRLPLTQGQTRSLGERRATTIPVPSTIPSFSFSFARRLSRNRAMA